MIGKRPLSRRTLLQGAALAAGAALTLPGVASAGQDGFGRKRRIPPERISVQLYTLRSLLENDLEGTLSALSDIGYRHVELAGTYGRTAAEFRKILDRNCLRATSSHIGIDGDLDKTIADAKTFGHTYSAVPYVRYGTIAEWEDFAKRLDIASRQFAKAGIQFGYHNHDFEFTAIDGVRPYDVISRLTNRRYCHFEVDLYWAVVAGQDPVEIYRRERRVLQYHVKDRGADGGWADLGTGNIDFPRIFRETAPGIREFIVEHDNPADPLKTAEVGYDYLRNVRF
ncbi:sugar phosphate isomerase/epimerase [Amycolatopsis sp.]|uniref:sugar phosphate isomerase/epimerase family protein n=1 Tax=Amycolatopsis sp. TaxID=37632 RepID=UPI002DF9A5B3|nr:sugar phosphate isomerase/epimerase [Amycolatopsis sp.]